MAKYAENKEEKLRRNGRK